jgi:hypoxanthine phosphoribosyltransferase
MNLLCCDDLKVLIREEVIQQRVRELGAQITADYSGQSLRLVGVLKGAWMFLADLIRHIELAEITVDFLGFTSYGNSLKSSGEVKITKGLDLGIEGLNVLVVEDILDTGETFYYLRQVLESAQPKSIRLVTLLDKASRRTRPVRPDYAGFTIPDVFVVGYGLDYAQCYRQLRDIRVLPSSDRS